MNNNKLMEYKKMMTEEIERRKRIEELQKTKLVIEYLKLNNLSALDIDYSIDAIVKNVLQSFYVQDDESSKKLYVCIEAFDKNCNVLPNDPEAIVKLYRDVEATYAFKEAVKQGYEDFNMHGCIMEENYYRPYIDSFESEHIILNPYNNSIENSKAFDEIRFDYYSSLMKYGDENKALQKILKKYHSNYWL